MRVDQLWETNEMIVFPVCAGTSVGRRADQLAEPAQMGRAAPDAGDRRDLNRPPRGGIQPGKPLGREVDQPIGHPERPRPVGGGRPVAPAGVDQVPKQGGDQQR